ncbi:3-oxoacyl-[acyl-carrier-protein] reductase [Desulfomicrobium baculatum]|jgi:3-oxoacyl-[acyl-carrier protein] reductase|uniref:3-oxoacyl-[acyl-carrier-protein] reductase n=1 Tax=Desulfomicrobium baculatum (strain DSM 4028 / VKM B-1378 / X) TaxID=525897 RepID=C7LSI3_DESBD|nr:3-oxoacyl-[acyl-carrier-protein] reductase [Desulfomicrobium baculatum]ACU88197.1 3-oxoacyl-(acyl-carrier-protein) reductase [Desulfomicrobium baculatum DSM 4028]
MSELVRTALVTGGTRGIGKAIVKKLAGLGYQVYFTYVSRPELAEAVCAEVMADGGAARGFLLDASDWDAVADFFATEIKDKVSLELLVNNAGITKDGLIMRMKREQWEQVIQINLTGAFVCLQQAAKIMLKQRKGRIVNISSVVGQMGNAGQANYCASKAGLIGLTKAAALELGSRGITVNAIAPGFIETDMTETLPQDVRDKYLERIPLGRLGSAQAIADAVAYLASDQAEYITGQVLGINGGMYL